MGDGRGEAVVGLLYVSLLPVALPGTDPGPGQSRVPLHCRHQECLRLWAVLWDDVQRPSSQVRKLLPWQQVCGGGKCVSVQPL